MKILYLCDRYYWEKKTSRVRFHAIDALFRDPSVSGIKDGPGFPEWKDVPTSVERHNPDFIFWYMPLRMEGHDKVTVPKILSYNEAYAIKGVTKEVTESKTDIVIFHYLNTMKDFPHLHSACQMINIPHCVEKNIFKDYHLPKCYDILFTGAHGKNFYPLRSRLYKMIKKGCFNKCIVKIREHPGKRIDTVDTQVIEYAQDINKAKLVFTCSMTLKNAVAKYSEIPACNSLLIGDLPDERHEFFKEFLVEITNEMSDKAIVDVVSYWLSHTKEREERARRGMALTLSNNTQEHYTKKVIETLSSYRHGGTL